MNAIATLFSTHLVQALGYTLLHSLWQGALVAIALSVVLIAMRRSSSAARYTASVGAMLLLLCTVAATFGWLFTSAAGAVSGSGAITLHQLNGLQPEPVTATAGLDGTLNSLNAFFGHHLPLLVLAWVVGALFMLLRLIGGLVLVQRMRWHKLVAVPAAWQVRVSSLRERAGIARAVQLAESALVKVPLTIGVLKPVILLPLGTLAGIPANQVEAILAHELAHIARKDFLINLIQSFVEVLFFYHPALWWISNCVRTEREHCCDDRAIALCGDSVTFACALASIEEFAQPHPVMAMAVTGKKGSLLHRVRRLLGQPTSDASFGEGFWSGCALAAVLLAALLVLLFTKPVSDAQAAIPANADLNWLTVETGAAIAKAPSAAEKSATAADTDLLATSVLVADTTGKISNLIIIKNKKGKVVDLYVDGYRVPKKNIADYTPQINQALAAQEVAGKGKKLSKKEERKQIEQSLEQARNRKEAETYSYHYGKGDKDSHFHYDFNSPSMHIVVPPMPPMPPVAPYTANKAGQERHKKEMEAYEKEMEEFEQEMKEYEREMKELDIELAANEAELKANEAELRANEAELRANEAARRAEEKHLRNAGPAEREKERNRSVMLGELGFPVNDLKELAAKLKHDKLIGEKDKRFSFEMDRSTLRINGKKQPAEVYERYRSFLKEKTGRDISKNGTLHFEYEE